MKYIALLFCSVFFMFLKLKSQEKNQVDLIQSYVDSMDKVIGIKRSELLKRNDSIIIIHHKGSVYQIDKIGETYKIVQVVFLEKTKDGRNRKVSNKISMRSDTFYVGKANRDNIINSQTFNELFDLRNVSGDKSALNWKRGPAERPNMLDLYLESISKGEYRFRNLFALLLDDINCGDKRLDEFMKSLFLKFNHWDVIDKMVKENGYGEYKLSKYNVGMWFEYKSNGKYTVKGLSREFNKMPRL